MSGMINNNVNIGISLTQEIIQKPQKYTSFQGKSYNEPKKDTVEISSKQNEDSAKLSKWKKSALAIGAVALAGLGLGIGVKKIGTKQIEKAAEEARKLAKEAQLKAQKEAEQKAEEARIQAEQRAKELAEQRAKELAERKAKIEAEAKAKAEAERIAKIEAERVAKAKQKHETFNLFTRTNHFDSVITTELQPETFKKDGIPLQYSRDSFLQDLKNTLDSCSKEEQRAIKSKYDIEFSSTDFNDIGFELRALPGLPKEIGQSKNERKIAEIIKHFTQENETTVENPEVKRFIDSILHEIPEFSAIVGKKQHDTHIFSVDVHTLRNLQDNLTNYRIQGLDEDSKTVLKYATLLHDLGKEFIRDSVPDTGHAARSKLYAQEILSRLDLPQNIKDRIIKQVENHHWFKEYNQEKLSAEGVVNIFGTKEDITIAEIMAKSDLKNVNNIFHKQCMGINLNYPDREYFRLIETQFAKIDKIINSKIAKEKGLIPDRHGITPIASDAEYLEEMEQLKQLTSRPMFNRTYTQVSDERGTQSYMFKTREENVPARYKSLVGYIGTNGPIYELYRDINLYLSKKSDIVMNPVEDGTIIKDYMTELVNVDSEIAKRIIRCMDYSLKEVDKEFGKFDGIVYRRGRFSADGGQYYSTTPFASTGIGDDTQLQIIRTKNGHKLKDFQQKYYNETSASTEEEILLPRDTKYKEITDTTQYMDERRKFAQKYYEFYKQLDEDSRSGNKYNYTFDDIMSRIHVWEEL